MTLVLENSKSILSMAVFLFAPILKKILYAFLIEFLSCLENPRLFNPTKLTPLYKVEHLGQL